MSQDLEKLTDERMEVLMPKEVDISPEGLEIANLYLSSSGDCNLVAETLGVPLQQVTKELNRREVKRYIDTIYMDMGYRNRFALSKVLDSVIGKKLEEMEEAEIGSSKDIADLLLLAHKMRMEEIDAMLKYEKLQQNRELAYIKERSKVIHTGPTINIQDNSYGGSNYGALLAQLMESK
jgi:hypothetical protein